MNANLILENLHLKFANKTWNETFNLVRTCTEKPMEWCKPSRPVCSALERLQEVLNASSNNLIRLHLQRMARQQGMDFHITKATCCLTADLFRLEVALLPCGGVENVKLTPHAGFPICCESLLQLLRAENFSQFSAKLADLLSQYNIPGDKETKLRLFESLQLLEQDLQCMSSFPKVQPDSEAQTQLINDGLMGCLKAANADHPLTIQFYSVPAPGSNASALFVQGAQVTVGASDATHKLQLASALVEPAVTEDQRTPVFLPLSEVPHQSLPGCFLLRLQPPMPLILSFITKIINITGVVLPDVDLQGEPLPKVLTSGCATSPKEDEKDAVFSEGFILPVAAWDVPAQRAAVVDHIPFSHPSHVPALLEILRHQSAINALLRSCVATAAAEYPLSDPYELLPESETSFSVTFQRRDADSLAVLLVNIADCRQISCKLFGAGTQDPSSVETLSSVLTRSMSVPLTLMAVHSQPVHAAPPKAAADGTPSSQSAFVPED